MYALTFAHFHVQLTTQSGSNSNLIHNFKRTDKKKEYPLAFKFFQNDTLRLVYRPAAQKHNYGLYRHMVITELLQSVNKTLASIGHP